MDRGGAVVHPTALYDNDELVSGRALCMHTRLVFMWTFVSAEPAAAVWTDDVANGRLQEVKLVLLMPSTPIH